MAKDMERSSESIATSEEFVMIGNGENDSDSKPGDQPQVASVPKPETLELSQADEEKLMPDSKVLDKTATSSERRLKGEIVTRHPLASPVSPQTKGDLKLKMQLQKEDNPTAEESMQSTDSSSPSPIDNGSVSRSSSLQFVDTDCTLFTRVTYLGCAAVNAPKSEKEMQRNMAILNDQALDQAMEITLSVPSHSEGAVILLEGDSTNELASFAINQIMFCARGLPDSREKECFAFACSHGSSAETAIFQCHVFKCDSSETVLKLLQTFRAAFFKNPKIQMMRGDSTISEKAPIGMSIRNNHQLYVYETVLDIKEEDLKGNFVSCPRDKDSFKFRSGLEKMVTVTVNQISNNKELIIQRCFGLLISPGRNLKHTDMHILEGVVMNRVLSGEKAVYHISANWNPLEPAFEILNTVTPRDRQVYFTVAVDLVFAGIEEPVRFVIETKAKIFLPTERFWHLTKKVLHEQFYLRVKETESENGQEILYEVMSLQSSNQRKNPHLFNLSHRGSSHSLSSQLDQETESDNDEPLLSGTGEVSKECSDYELEGWSEVLDKWRQNLKLRPKQLPVLVRRGIPEALRGEIWPLLAGCTDDKEIVDTYKNLIGKESASGNVIQRDINRTFPAHEHFRESGSVGQDSLYKICKAYSIYDSEIGYCQGQSYLAAALLLHMPEEQAFSVLVKIMYEYKLRDFFKNGFEELHLKLFQLEKLLEVHLPELYAHFLDLGVEAHMFASQWFLTLFTAKFPLFVVFYILDIFLLDGINILFQVSLSLLMLSKRDLLALDFEGVLKYFRVSLPKRYRSEENARLLIATANSLKIKNLKKFSREFALLKDQEKQHESPVQKLQRENSRFQMSNMRLEHENDELANELVTVTSQLGKELKMVQEKAEMYSRELGITKKAKAEVEDEKRRLETEVSQLKELCRRELQQAEAEISRSNTIITEYKQICSQLNARLEDEQSRMHQYVSQVKSVLSSCENCYKRLFSEKDAAPDMKSAVNTEEMKSGDLLDAEKQIRELELELAQTKLALVEVECKNQDLTHRLNSAVAEIQASKNTWLHKTWSSLRDVTKKESSHDGKEKDAS